MYLVPKFSYVDFCATVNLAKVWDFPNAMDFTTNMDNFIVVWYLVKQ